MIWPKCEDQGCLVCLKNKTKVGGVIKKKKKTVTYWFERKFIGSSKVLRSWHVLTGV